MKQMLKGLYNVRGFVLLGNVYIQLKVQRDAHGFVCILFFTMFALHVSGAIDTHHQEHKLQSTEFKIDRAESVRVSQPESAPMDYPTSHIP
jgi:hypothetical protein